MTSIPSLVWQLDIKQQDIRISGSNKFDCFCPIHAFSDNYHILCAVCSRFFIPVRTPE